ncbi:hypothetical protein CLV28_0159 [Sediminihabitans luteus]|uniref:CDP-glycerol:poly(Glycerophosphate) glycerophosphotransferase n=1 Tax=Sediminihabitans luteus TaxID=1138585 RepID=A0A2M9CYG5_9CELL|nr:DUF6716 putative glycosyltransferase [Sediminihabitans luteus]PJJ76947.1 hypothetical protein CLV28_0159 [Sediminihabitans luteus]GII99588.1 hypothetical protein Slu03_19660 [Sediminihabitans luteus]
MPPTATLVLAYDSQLKWALGIGDELARRGFACRYVVPTDVRHAVSDGQATDHGAGALERITWAETHVAADGSDVVVLAVQGPLASRFLAERADRPSVDGRVPVTITGWVGVIIEKHVAGYLERFGADVVAVNTRHDLDQFREVARRLELPTHNLLLSGLPLLPAAPEPPRGGPVRTVVFADQPTVPRRRDDRAYVYARLVEHARRHPEREVLLKPRHRPDEDTFHVMRHHPAAIVADWDLPANFRIDYTPVTELLPRTDLLLTVSSTAAMEGVAAGVRTAFVGDLGVHEQHGNHIFVPSGLIRTFDQVDRDDLGSPAPDWLADYFLGDDRRPVERIVDRALEVLALDPAQRASTAARTTAYFRGRVEVAEYRDKQAQQAGHSTRPRAPRPRAVRTVRWRPGLRGRALLVATALLPHRTVGWLRTHL